VFAFGAKDFLPNEPTSFIINTINAVLLEGFDPNTAMPGLLKGAESIGTHTSIVHIQKGLFSEYCWSDPRKMPNCQPLIQQCSHCLCLRWFDISFKWSSIVYTCEGGMTAGKKCGYQMIYSAVLVGQKVKVINAEACWVKNSIVPTLV
jgi:hypothetical protein